MSIVRFEMEIIGGATYSELYNLKNSLEKVKDTHEAMKELCRISGRISDSAKHEHELMTIRHNLNLIEVAMLSREGEVFEFTTFESFCLN